MLLTKSQGNPEYNNFVKIDRNNATFSENSWRTLIMFIDITSKERNRLNIR